MWVEWLHAKNYIYEYNSNIIKCLFADKSAVKKILGVFYARS